MSFVLGGKAIRKADPWTLTLEAGFLYQTDADGDTSAERWAGRVRVDRALSGRTYVFGQAIFDRDEPADIEYRVTGLAGIRRFLIQRDNEELKAELGGGLVYEKRVGVDATTDPAGYVGVHYWRAWANKQRFAADFEFIRT
jgi:putative salt-induced outer membrane protein YdiY